MDIIKINNEKLDETISLIRPINIEVIEFIERFRKIEQQISVLYSIKVTKNKVITNRVAITIDYSDNSNLYTLDNLLLLVKQYSFPEACIEQLVAEYNKSTFRSFNVWVGIEVDEDKTRYKVYIEDSATKNLFAIKWDDVAYVITNYIFREKDLVEETIHEAGYDIIPQLVLDNDLKLTQIYLTKDSIGSNRTSFNLAFKDLYLNNITNDMLSLTSVDILKEFDYLKKYPIRIVAGGLDSSNNKYFTLYFII